MHANCKISIYSSDLKEKHRLSKAIVYFNPFFSLNDSAKVYNSQSSNKISWLALKREVSFVPLWKMQCSRPMILSMIEFVFVIVVSIRFGSHSNRFDTYLKWFKRPYLALCVWWYVAAVSFNSSELAGKRAVDKWFETN